MDYSLGIIVLAIVCFLAIALSILGFGRFLEKYLFKTFETPYSSLAIGSMSISFIISLYGLVPGALNQYSMLFFIFLGIALNIPCGLPKPNINFKDPIHLFFCILIIFTFIHGLHPNKGIDPLYYHIYAPKWWFKQGHITFDENYPRLFQAAFWEYLYLLVNAFVPKYTMKHLIINQMVNQLIHICIAYLGVILVLPSLIKKFFGESRWNNVALICGVISYSIAWTTKHAKNDWAISFWLIWGMATLFGSVVNKKQIFLGGMALGMAMMTKLNAAFFIIPFGLYWIFKNKEKTPLCAAGLITGLLPIMGRNFAFTKNPFFPTLNSIFPSNFLGESLIYDFSLYEGNSFQSLATIIMRVVEVFEEGPLNAFFFIIPLLFLYEKFIKKKTTNHGLFVFSGLTLIAFTIYSTKAGMHTQLRLFGPGNIFLGLCSVFALKAFIEHLPSHKYKNHLPTISLIFAIAFSHIPFHSIKIMKKHLAHASNNILYEHWAGEETKWLYENYPANSKTLIITTGFHSLFYLTGYSLIVIPESAKFDALTLNQMDPQLLIEDVKNNIDLNNFDHVIFMDAFYAYTGHKKYWSKVSKRIREYLESREDKLLQTKLSVLIGLK